MKPHQIAESIWFALAHKLLPLLAFLVFAVPGFVLIAFLRGRKVSGAENYGGTIILLGLAAAFFIKVVLYTIKADKRLSFSDGCAVVFYSWLLYLHFVPILGAILSRWAEEKKARINPFIIPYEEGRA